ncbi:hypothetical protein CEXT_212951 [Caerostris extrusa]|uniref:Uncharacterized protein n=1 Tax=Caerostris extrusa TaxID=172846 RepID=A0AAV4UDG8_CAEEX|nr:hypothetical protein CEXT_212951 [Caerostris extrusa]
MKSIINLLCPEDGFIMASHSYLHPISFYQLSPFCDEQNENFVPSISLFTSRPFFGNASSMVTDISVRALCGSRIAEESIFPLQLPFLIFVRLLRRGEGIH